jgi:hypothetical protein
MILILVLSMNIHAQNLVPNPSFEEYITCPISGVTLGRASNWTVPEQGLTPDYFKRYLVLNNRKLGISEMGNTLVEDLDEVSFATQSVAFLK